MQKRQAFTLIEVLISIGLLGIIISALFSTVSMMRKSNQHLLGYLDKAQLTTQATKVLYLDILSSNGLLDISKRDDFTRLCIEETTNSLYELPLAKVCWVVLKEDKSLLRVEGNHFKLPLRFDTKVEVDTVLEHLELFDVTRNDDKVVIVLKEENKKPLSFMLQGIFKPKPPVKKNSKKATNQSTSKVVAP